VSSSSIDNRFDAAPGKRLGAALAASAALHFLVVVGGLHMPAAGLPGPMKHIGPEAGSLHARLQHVQEPQAGAVARVSERPTTARQARTGASGSYLLPAQRYYSVRELDVRPGIMVDVQPEYPAEAAGTAGRVIVRLFIGEEGGVERLAIQEAEPPGLFEQSVERAFAAARFSPGIKDGRPVKVTLALQVNFEKGPE
jgi:TonB family protein